MRLRRGAAVAAIAGGGALTTMLIGLVTNAVSDQARWPGFLGWVQHHAWFSFAALGVALVGLTALLAGLSEARDTGPTGQPGADDPVGPPGAALVLRSLPRDATAFTNRSAELERLVASVRTAQDSGRSLPVHVIDGMPGVGKTTFAVHAGHVLSERFPDGQLFLNLNGHTSGQSPVCGGGHLPHRFGAGRGYRNPSVYCADLEHLIRHVQGSLRRHGWDLGDRGVTAASPP
ncbi:hypothetical protein ACWD25_14270 [Streptomyces sp. NPDC002920]